MDKKDLNEQDIRTKFILPSAFLCTWSKAGGLDSESRL